AARMGTRIRLFLAFSTPLRMESGTSLAFPSPTPTTPWPSPTTTTALKLKRRPPLTTLATRLTRTTFSSRVRPVGSILGMHASHDSDLAKTQAHPRGPHRLRPSRVRDTCNHLGQRPRFRRQRRAPSRRWPAQPRAP